MNISDYKCPSCRRIRRRKGRSPTIAAKCGCSDAILVMPRICWSKADWTKVNHALSEEMDVPESVVAAKRRELGKKRGTAGRRVDTDNMRAAATAARKVNPDDVDVTLSAAENWRRLTAKGVTVSQQRIRQIKQSKLRDLFNVNNFGGNEHNP